MPTGQGSNLAIDKHGHCRNVAGKGLLNQQLIPAAGGKLYSSYLMDQVLLYCWF